MIGLFLGSTDFPKIILKKIKKKKKKKKRELFFLGVFFIWEGKGERKTKSLNPKYKKGK